MAALKMNRGAVLLPVAALAGVCLIACNKLVGLDSGTGPLGPTGKVGGAAISLSANVAAPSDINALSQFNSCVGHPFPSQNSANSGKNYFWPNSTNFGSTNQLRLYAACDGITGQAPDDLGVNLPYRGQSLHLYCDNSSTSLRYFHINYTLAMAGQHFKAGDLLGYAYLLGDGTVPPAIWQTSSNFDIAVSEGDDASTEDYFAKLTPAALAAWGVRGLTSVSQTVNTGNTNCTSYSSNIGDPGIFVLRPSL